ncbi:IS1380 family transposase [Acidiferrimicrobium sp. IK]|uniref:IS1380 family transposase n=1 Tax=Acidiferrimicrobium sp. IK TaxID=2871700 RepID=UPI0021CB4F3C|nr:IS1380 family transposase [Acidiferrimicrobium sp. IK]
METYGLAKAGGSRFSYAYVRGYHPLFATIAATGDVVHSRLRGGPAHSARGASSFLAETFARVRAAGATGPLVVRADSGFYNQKVIAACTTAGVDYSVTTKMSKPLRDAIAKIADQDWTAIPYFLADGADVAEIDYQAFTKSKNAPGGIKTRLIVRRVRPTPGSQLALFVTWSYHAFITNRTGTVAALEADHRRHAVVENTIRDLKYGVGLNHLPSGRFGANAAWLTLNVIAHNMAAWTARLGGLDTTPDTTADHPRDDEPTRPDRRRSFVATDTLRRRYLHIPGRITTSGRRRTLHLPTNWPWRQAFDQTLATLRTVTLTT